jgi:ribosome-binding protein aMBF1 (putative translation factor)
MLAATPMRRYAIRHYNVLVFLLSGDNAMRTKLSREVGARIRQTRKDRGLTLTELGSKLGVSYQMVQRYESGRALTLPRIEAIARALDVEYQNLILRRD